MRVKENNLERVAYLDAEHVANIVDHKCIVDILNSINKKYTVTFYKLNSVKCKVEEIEIELSYKDNSIMSIFIITDINKDTGNDYLLSYYRREKGYLRMLDAFGLLKIQNQDYSDYDLIKLLKLLEEDPDNNAFMKAQALPEFEYDIKNMINIKENTPHYEDKGIITEPLILEPEDWSVWQWSVLLKLFGLKEAERIKISDYHLEYFGVEKDRTRKNDNKLDESIRRQIIIKTQNSDEEYRIANKIHEKLAGNQDYIDSRIVLNMSADRLDDDTENEVHLYIFNDSESDPEICI